MLRYSGKILSLVCLLVSIGIGFAQEDTGTIYTQLTSDFDQLDPHLTNNSLGYQMAVTFYDRLTALDDDGNVIPALATSWEGSGADQVTFTLNPDATCTDGTPLGAEAVANSLLRMGADATGSPYMYRTLGGTAGNTENKYSVEFDNDAGTVTMIMNEPFSGLLIGLAMPWASVVCPAGLENPDSLVEEPQGSGPYTMTEALRGDRYVVDARPEYTWGARGITTADEGFPQRIVYQVVTNPTTAANLFLSGDLDVITGLTADLDRVEAYAEENGLFQTQGLNFGGRWIHMNQDEGLIGTNPAVRQAVFKAISAEEYLDVNYEGRGVVVNAFISPSSFCYDESLDSLYEETVGYDPEGARQVLIDAGFVEDANGMFMDESGNPLTIRFVSGAEGGDLTATELWILSWEEIGLTVDARITDFGGLTEALFASGEWDVAELPYGPPVPLPSAAQAFLSGDTATNTGNIHNETFVTESSAANSATDEAEICGHWSNAMAALLQDIEYKPTVADYGLWFGDGVEFTLFNGYPFTFDPLTIRITG